MKSEPPPSPQVLYDEFAWRSAAAADVGLAKSFQSVIKRLKGVKSICDLGSGNGYMSGSLAELGYQVTGVDASPSGLEIARQNHPKPTFIFSVIDSQLAGNCGLGQFDLVLSSDVIEHMFRPADLVEAASSLLGPNGHLLLGTPYHGYLKNLVLSLTGKMDNHFSALDVAGHIKFFSVKTLSSLVERHGFRDLEFSFYGRAPWLWMNMICHARKVA